MQYENFAQLLSSDKGAEVQKQHEEDLKAKLERKRKGSPVFGNYPFKTLKSMMQEAKK